MSPPSQPIPLICLGKHRDLAERMHANFFPAVSYNAIMTEWSKPLLYTLLDNLYPTPAGIVVGGGFDDCAEEVQEAVTEWTATRQTQPRVKVLTVPKTLMQEEGPAAVGKYMKSKLTEEFGVSW